MGIAILVLGITGGAVWLFASEAFLGIESQILNEAQYNLLKKAVLKVDPRLSETKLLFSRSSDDLDSFKKKVNDIGKVLILM